MRPSPPRLLPRSRFGSGSTQGCSSSDCSETVSDPKYPVYGSDPVYSVYVVKTPILSKSPFLPVKVNEQHEYRNHWAIVTPKKSMEFVRLRGHRRLSPFHILNSQLLDPKRWDRSPGKQGGKPALKRYCVGYTTEQHIEKMQEYAEQLSGNMYMLGINDCQTSACLLAEMLIVKGLSRHPSSSTRAQAEKAKFVRHREKYLLPAREAFRHHAEMAVEKAWQRGTQPVSSLIAQILAKK